MTTKQLEKILEAAEHWIVMEWHFRLGRTAFQSHDHMLRYLRAEEYLREAVAGVADLNEATKVIRKRKNQSELQPIIPGTLAAKALRTYKHDAAASKARLVSRRKFYGV